MSHLASRLAEIRDRPAPPAREAYVDTLARVRRALATEPPEVRPADPRGRPGGLVRLAPDLPTLLVPDLHARLDFLLACLPGEAGPGGDDHRPGPWRARRLQVVCLGDGVHSEGRGARRWRTALDEFHDEYRRSTRAWTRRCGKASA